MKKRIYLSPPHMTGEEIKYVEDAIQSNWVAPVGPHIDAFEKELAETIGVQNSVAVNSGTSAIHLALLALGVGPGDEVICPTLTFCATINPIIYCGATPILIDSEWDTWNINPDLIRIAIQERKKETGSKPKAIIVVHLYGMPAKMDEIMAISEEFDIPVLEDAAEALGSQYKGKPLGSIGQVGILSFNGNKIITTSGGGAVISTSRSVLEKVRYLRQEAKEPLPYYEHKEVGYNYRLSNVSAAIGRAQLRALQDRVTRRREIFQTYKQEVVERTGEIAYQQEPKGSFSNRWLTAILFKECDERLNRNHLVREELEKHNIESRLTWKPMHLQSIYSRYLVYGGEVAEYVFRTGLCLPSGSALEERELRTIAGILMEFVEKRK